MLCLIQVLEIHLIRNQNVVTLDVCMENFEFQAIMSKYSHTENLGDISGMNTIL